MMPLLKHVFVVRFFAAVDRAFVFVPEVGPHLAGLMEGEDQSWPIPQEAAPLKARLPFTTKVNLLA